jgi:hypothetical protein
LVATDLAGAGAKDQRARAERRFEEGRKLANLLIYKLHDESRETRRVYARRGS